MLPSFLVLGIVSYLYYSKNIYLYVVGLLLAVIYSYYINKGLVDKVIKKITKKFRRG